MNKIIRLESLRIGYPGKKGEKIVAENLNASINQGELTCLLGVNGIGKSTLLRTLSAFQPKLSGKILIKGKNIEEYTSSELSHILSVVLTDRPDIRNMTAEELIGLGRTPYTGFWGTLNEKDKKIVRQCISQIHIENLAHRMIHTLSDGERQKVMIAKALAQETPIIFLDEPTAFLDFPSKIEIMQLLHRLSRETQKTIFLSTHDMELAIQMADKLWVMDKTRGLTVGSPEDLSLNGELSRFFGTKGIHYDMEKGVFRVENKYKDRVKLTGEGSRYVMVAKALARNGIEAGRETESEIHIEISAGKNEYIIYALGAVPVAVNSIEELLHTLTGYSGRKN